MNNIILCGSSANEELQATFKVVKNTNVKTTDAIIKTRVIQAINEFFALDNWDFGDSFYFTELAAYIHNQLAPDLLTVVIVPNQSGQVFGSLFQINSDSNEARFSKCLVVVPVEGILTSIDVTLLSTSLFNSSTSRQINFEFSSRSSTRPVTITGWSLTSL